MALAPPSEPIVPGGEAEQQDSSFNNRWRRFSTSMKTFGASVGEKASIFGTVVSEKASIAGTFVSEKAKAANEKTGFTEGVKRVGNTTSEKLKTFDETYGVSRKTGEALVSVKKGATYGLGVTRSSLKLWSLDLRFFDANRLDTFKLFERFDKDKDETLNKEEFEVLIATMFQWFETQHGPAHYIQTKSELEADITNTVIQAYSRWNVDPETNSINKHDFVSNWISFFSELESIHVTFRDIAPPEGPADENLMPAPEPESQL